MLLILYFNSLIIKIKFSPYKCPINFSSKPSIFSTFNPNLKTTISLTSLSSQICIPALYTPPPLRLKTPLPDKSSFKSLSSPSLPKLVKDRPKINPNPFCTTCRNISSLSFNTWLQKPLSSLKTFKDPKLKCWNAQRSSLNSLRLKREKQKNNWCQYLASSMRKKFPNQIQFTAVWLRNTQLKFWNNLLDNSKSIIFRPSRVKKWLKNTFRTARWKGRLSSRNTLRVS